MAEAGFVRSRPVWGVRALGRLGLQLGLAAVLLSAAAPAAAADSSGKSEKVGQYVDMSPVAVPVIWRGRLVNYVFVTLRLIIRPGLDAGAEVGCDRFVDSSLAYQGGADGLGADAIRTLHAIGSGGLLPDRTILLSLPEAEAIARETARDGGRPDRFGARDVAYHRAVIDSFRGLAARDPRRWRVVDAEGETDAVTARLIAAIEDLA